MADPRHPVRDNSRALGLVPERTKSDGGAGDGADLENGDDFARALDAALDAIRTAIHEDDDAPAAEQAVPQPDEKPVQTAIAGSKREQRAFREISSDIAARHPELRNHVEPAKPDARVTPMPSAATLASSPLPRQRLREPLSYEPYAPQVLTPGGGRLPPTAPVPANDMDEAPLMGLRSRHAGPITAPRGEGWRDDAARPVIEPSRAFAQENISERAGTRSPAPPASAPRSRAMQPDDLPAFGKNHDGDTAAPRGKGKVFAVSAIALTAALGLGAVTVWMGYDLSSPPADGGLNLAATAPAAGPQAAPPAAADTAPARLEVGAVSGTAGGAVDLDVRLTAAPGERTAVLISGLPVDSTLSSGVDTGKGVWIVKPGDLDGLQVTTPAGSRATNSVKFELVASNGLTLDVKSAELNLASAEPAAPVAAEPVTAGLAPKPVKTVTLDTTSSTLTPTASSRESSLPAPPNAPRAEAPAQSAGGGGGSAADATTVQIAERSQTGGEPVKDLNKVPSAQQSESQPVQLAAINPAQKPEPAQRVATPRPLSPEMQELVNRGNALMEIGDLASARLFYERAAEAGSADAALAMAKSYDPIYFEEMDVHGMPPNAERAMQWYEKAAGLGSSEATTRMSALKGRL